MQSSKLLLFFTLTLTASLCGVLPVIDDEDITMVEKRKKVDENRAKEAMTKIHPYKKIVGNYLLNTFLSTAYYDENSNNKPLTGWSFPDNEINQKLSVLPLDLSHYLIELIEHNLTLLYVEEEDKELSFKLTGLSLVIGRNLKRNS